MASEKAYLKKTKRHAELLGLLIQLCATLQAFYPPKPPLPSSAPWSSPADKSQPCCTIMQEQVRGGLLG